MIVAIDFDGTMVKEAFPKIGEELPGAVETMKWMNSVGIKIILFTMRSNDAMCDDFGKTVPCTNPEQSVLWDAINWCKDRGVSLWSVNYNPEQASWSTSRKVYADYYIDDRSIGVPTKPDGTLDWVRIKMELAKKMNKH